MDEALQTAATYEDNADAYREKYLTASVAEQFGGPFFDALDGDRVLDVGCGPGSDAAVFAGRGVDVVGVDVAQSFLTEASEGVDGAFCRGDVRHLPFASGSFDGVWACASLHHVPKSDVVDALAECRRVLAPDGCFFCSVKRGDGEGLEPDENHGGGDDRFFAYYAGNEFADCLDEAGFAGDVTTEGRWVNVLAYPA